MITITERVNQYLDCRDSMGTGLSNSPVLILRKFGSFADDQGARHVTTDLFLRWRGEYGNGSRLTWACRLSHVRTFARWLQCLDAETEVPPKGLVVASKTRPKPHVYTDEEILALVRVAAKLYSPLGIGLRGPTHNTLIGLMSVTGIRTGEAIWLDDGDVDTRAATLHVRHAKNRARRVIPLTPCSVERLAEYRRVRNRSVIRQDLAFFLGENGRRISKDAVLYAFARCSQTVGLRNRQEGSRNGIGPRLHDLRHTFAVRTIIGWHRAGLDVDREMYKLTAWLGHKNPKETYWYLEAVPELLRIAAENAEAAWAGRCRS